MSKVPLALKPVSLILFLFFRFSGFFGLSYPLLIFSPVTKSELVRHLREGKDKEEAHSVDDVEENDLGNQEVSAVLLELSALFASYAEAGMVGEDVGNETEQRPDSSDLVETHEEFSAEKGDLHKECCTEPLADVVDSQ